MSFSHHEPCPRCGSRDNLARYRDGSGWCFGCGHREKATVSSYVMSNLHKGRERHEDSGEQQPQMPDDVGTQFSEDAVRWMERFYLDVPTAIRRGVLYSATRDQIIYQLGHVWQARNLKAGGSDGNSRRRFSKNFTSGNVNECLHIYAVPDSTRDEGRNLEVESDSLVIVEDPVSAIRVAALYDAMPLLGSHLATSRLNAVAGLYKAVVVWLDSDKLKEARSIAERFRMVGVSARVIWTELDPKEYSDRELMEILS